MRSSFRKLVEFCLNAFLIKSSYGLFWFVQTIQYLFYYPEYSLNWLRSIPTGSYYRYHYTYTLCWCIWYWIYCFGTNSNRSGGAFGKCADALYKFAVFFVIGMIMAKEEIVDRWGSYLKSETIRYCRMAAFDTCDCSESEFTTHDFCSVFRSCFDCVIWHIQLGRQWRRYYCSSWKHSTNMWLTHMQFIWYCANTCIRIKECL